MTEKTQDNKMATSSEEMRERERRERRKKHAAEMAAIATRKPVTFIAADGSEVTVTPQGHVFYNDNDA